MLLICRHDYWPGLTPDKLWELPLEQWGPLAIAVDRISAERERAADELKNKMRR